MDNEPLPKLLNILLGGCREPVPPRFQRSFEGVMFDGCSCCQSPLLEDGASYTVMKFSIESELREEMALCRACSAELREGYSAESRLAIKRVFSDDYERRRVDLLFNLPDDADKTAGMTSACAICSTPREALREYFEYALCQGPEIVFYTQPSLVCGECAQALYLSLSEATRDHKHRFTAKYFSLPPSGSFERDPAQYPWSLLHLG